MFENSSEPFGTLLKQLRKRRRLTQQQLAEALGTHRNTIGRWEEGSFLPESKALVLDLARHLHLDEQETRQLLDASLLVPTPLWSVPYPRNSFFTGREDILATLHARLGPGQSVAPTQAYALRGLGGIGKTQLALEYAYRYALEYHAIFWINAETVEQVHTSLLRIAERLDIPEHMDTNQQRVVAAVLRWLETHGEWLLIWDNLEDLHLLQRFLPSVRQGAILITTRRHALGTLAQGINVPPMTQEEGTLFVLRRASVPHAQAIDALGQPGAMSMPTTHAAVSQLVLAMGGLPLALDQAGAYIEETACSFSDYLRLFQSFQQQLLDERAASTDHPLSVVRTFTLTFEQIEQSNVLAAEILTVCAYLSAEAIPVAFFQKGAAHLGSTFELLVTDPFAFDEAIKVLLSYSLLQRQADCRTVTIHRLVQAVLKGRLSEDVQRVWAVRVVRAMSLLFPMDAQQSDYWQVCEQLLPHALMCIALAEQWGESEALSLALMNHVANYLRDRAHYSEAEPLFRRALRIGERMPGPEHLSMAETLLGLAIFIRHQGQYAEAEVLCTRALHIRERAAGTEHLLVAEALQVLADLYQRQGKYVEAEPFYERALHIREHALKAGHPQVADALNGLANLYFDQGKYEQAELLYLRVLYIWEGASGSKHPQLGAPLCNLGELYREQGKYERAELFYQRALHIWEQAFGPAYPNEAYPLYGLGELYREQGQYEMAEPFYQRALRIWSNHPRRALPLHGLGELYRMRGQHERAEHSYQRALLIGEQALSPEHPQLAEPLTGLGTLYQEQGRYEQAESFYQRALRIWEQALGPEYPLLAGPLIGLGELYREQGRYELAEPLYRRALHIQKQALGAGHPKTIATEEQHAHLVQQHIHKI